MNYRYSEKLKHPKWQKKRLQILERAEWRCECCGDEESNLQVHHLTYSKGEPWDAPNETLECLCENCHDLREDMNKVFGGRSLMPTRVAYEFFFALRVLFDGSKKPDDWFSTKRHLIGDGDFEVIFRFLPEQAESPAPVAPPSAPPATEPPAQQVNFTQAL